MRDQNWSGKKVVITGGASFIGSHLTEKLVELGAIVRVIDDMSSGKYGYIAHLLDRKKIEFFPLDLLHTFYAQNYIELYAPHTVFHLAAIHGGRGYVDRQHALIASNFALDNIVFRAAIKGGAHRIVFASSGCVYPNSVQTNPEEAHFLKEGLVPPFDEKSPYGIEGYDSDGVYGYAKLMGEFQLKAFTEPYSVATVACRYFTAYGPRAKLDHAVMAMIARARVNQNPFEIWGDGTQVRNWTYVDDIVSGTIAAAEAAQPKRFDYYNIGTMEATTVLEAASKICKEMNINDPKFKFLTHMPTGPMNRVADNSKARDLIGWEPKVKFEEGIRKTIAWYLSSCTESDTRRALEEGSIIDGRSR